MTDRNEELKRFQAAADLVEKNMLEFLLRFSPARQLTIGDAKTICEHAQRTSFDAFEYLRNERIDG